MDQRSKSVPPARQMKAANLASTGFTASGAFTPRSSSVVPRSCSADRWDTCSTRSTSASEGRSSSKQRSANSDRMWGSDEVRLSFESSPVTARAKITRSVSAGVRSRSTPMTPPVTPRTSFFGDATPRANLFGADACPSPFGIKVFEPVRSSTERSLSVNSRLLRSTASSDCKTRTSSNLRSKSRSDSQGPSCAMDHCWPEIHHPPEQVTPRLRGDGKPIGRRGRSSAGVPWRRIPVYDPNGLMIETGDAYSPEQGAKAALPLDRKKTGPCARNLQTSSGMQEALATVNERYKLPCNVVVDRWAKEPCKASEAREAWLQVVRKRAEYKQTFKQAPEEKRVSKPAMHHVERTHKKVDQELDTKEACPFHRQDASVDGRSLRSATPHKKAGRTPSSSLCRTSLTPKHAAGPPTPSLKKGRSMSAARSR